MADKPTSVPRWATTGDIVEPSEEKKDTGYVPGERPPAQTENWRGNLLGLFASYLFDGILDGPFGVRGVISPTGLTGTLSNWSPTDLDEATTIRTDLTAAATITGIDDGETGRILVLVNLDATYVLTLAHDTTSDPENRILCPNGDSLPMGEGAVAILLYDAVVSRWRVIATNGCHGDRYVPSHWEPPIVGAAGAADGFIVTSGFYDFPTAGGQVVAYFTVPSGSRFKSYYFAANGDGATDISYSLYRCYHDRSSAPVQIDGPNNVNNVSNAWNIQTVTLATPEIVDPNYFYVLVLDVNNFSSDMALTSPRFRYDRPR